MPKTKTPKPVFILPFKIGGDPELLLFYGDKHIHAGNTIPKFLKTKYEQKENGYKIGENGALGWDGASATAEIRPKESNDVNQLTENIKQLFITANKEMPLFDMSTLSIGKPVGGHFHVEAPELFRDNDALQAKLRKIIATLLIPITSSEHKISSTQRTKGGYGQISDIRSHSEFKTIELRGPSAEWLTSEKICKSTISYIAVIWNEILKNHKELAKNRTTFRNLSQTKALQELITADYKPVTDTITKEIAKEIRKFELYPQFKEEVEFILNPEAVYKEKEKHGWNINNGWNLGNTATPTKKNLNEKKKIKEKVQAMDIELMTNTFSISYNDDYNVSTFANAISERIATLNWNLTHEYFLFGLKKETIGYIAAKASEHTGGYGLTKTCYTIPSNISKENSLTILNNIANRLQRETSNTLKINPKTGKACSGTSNTIIIGIPYEIRAKEDIKSLVDLIWNIENKKTKHQEIDKFTTQVVSNKDEINTKEIIDAGTSEQQFETEMRNDIEESIANYQQERVDEPTYIEIPVDTEEDNEDTE